MSDYLKEIKKIIRIIKTPKKDFNKRLIFYRQCFEEYKIWRMNFKFPKTEYLSRVKTLKPLPTFNLIKKLGLCISELREEYIELKGYKQIIIFKLFLFYLSEVLKVKYKIKILKSISGPFAGWVTGGYPPSRRDVDAIMSKIVEIFKFENFLSDKYQKFKPGYKYNSKKPMPVGTAWDWAKRKGFKWNTKWKPLQKKYGHQDSFAERDHYRGEPKSLAKTENMIKQYERLINKNNQSNSIEIANLFYELSYCKDFNEVEKIFSTKTNILQKKNKFNDWLPLKSEIGPNGKAIPWFEDNGGAYKNRVFPQFTLKNIKSRFDKEIFLDELDNYSLMKENYYHKEVVLAIVKALNADEELQYAFEYDEILPESEIITPAYTSGSIYNFLDKDLTFTTIFRSTSVILILSESSELCYGILSSKKRKKNYLIKYRSNRDGTTNCYMLKELSNKNFEKEASDLSNKAILEDIKFYAPDNLVLNKDFKFDVKKIIKKLKPLTLKKREEVLDFASDDEIEEKKELQKVTGTYIYLLNSKQFNKQIAEYRMDGSVRFSFPVKGGKPDYKEEPKLYSKSKINIKASYFI